MMFRSFLLLLVSLFSMFSYGVVNSMECSSDTSSGNMVCHDDDSSNNNNNNVGTRRRRRRLIDNKELEEALAQVAHSRELTSHEDDDCPLCEGSDWVCGAPLIACGEQNDGGTFNNCYCDVDLEGNAVCWEDEFCSLVTDCTSNDDCNDGYICANTCCPGIGQCAAKCGNIEGNQFENALPQDCDTCELNLPQPCDNNPCECDDTDNMMLCNICHENVGCSQCDNVGTNFKIDYNYPCINCQSVFGNECMFCQDFHGCAQCNEEEFYIRVYDETCGLWKCQDCRELYGQGCTLCQESQCGQCADGYTLVQNDDGIQVCV